MAGTVMPAPKFVGLDNNANPVSAGKLYTYLAGTTTPQPTYTDVNLTVANANPVVLDSAGRATVFLSGTSYKFVLTDANDVPIWTQDNVQAVAPFSTNLDIEGIAGETILAGQVCYLSDVSGALTAGRWYLADADNAYSSSRPQIAIVPDAIGSGESGTFRLQGAATKSNAQPDFVVGSTYYVSATAGQLSLTPGTNQRVVGQADSTTTLVISPNPPNVAVTPTFTDGITVVSTDAGASAGPYLDLYRESASPAVSDQIGDVRFSGEDSAGNKQLYARMYGQIADPTSTTEDGQLRFATIRNGVETLALVLDENGNLLPDGASQTIGSATKPWLVYHIGSGGSLNFANSDCTITHSTNTLTFAGASSGYVFNNGNVGIGVAPVANTLLTLLSAATNQQYVDVLRLETSDTGDRHPGIQFVGNRGGAAKYAKIAMDGGSTAATGDLAYFAEDEHQFYTGSGTSASGATLRMSLTGGGNLAIGATARLYLDGVAGTGDTYIEEVTGNELRIMAGGNERLRAVGANGVQITGALTIPSGTPLYLDGLFTGDTYLFESAANVAAIVCGGTTRFKVAATAVETYGTTGIGFYANGNGTNTGTTVVRNATDGYLYLTTSSRRFKENIAPAAITDAQLDAFLAVSPSWWDYTGQQNGALGFIAEDLAALPLKRYGYSPLCNFDKDGVVESNRDYALIAMHHLILQRMQTEIDALKAQIH
jgi:hypothetical protein